MLHFLKSWEFWNQLSAAGFFSFNIYDIRFFFGYGYSIFFVTTKSSVVKQKGKSQNGGYRKTKHIKFSEKRTHFLPPDTHVFEVFFENMTPAQVFSCEFHEISKNRFFQRITPVAASGVEAKFFWEGYWLWRTLKYLNPFLISKTE